MAGHISWVVISSEQMTFKLLLENILYQEIKSYWWGWLLGEFFFCHYLFYAFLQIC